MTTFAASIRFMKKFIYITLIAFVLNSCGEYQKVLQGDDLEQKFKLGEQLYEAGKYEKARNLFAQIVPKYRGKPQAEKLNYLYIKTFYEDKKYAEASFRMQQFVEIHPKSEKVDEVAFLAAKSYYNLSPIYSKEQKETIEAIGKIQEFINRFPDSQYTSEANELVQELDSKLERKAFEIAKQYHTTGPGKNDFTAAIKAFNNFLFNYPGTSYKEDAFYLRFDSAYQQAVNSVQRRKQERLNEAVGYYNELKKSFAESKYIDQVDKMHQELLDALKQFETQTTSK